jgi:hypothetical protein
MKYIKMFEAYEMPPRPDTKWIKVGGRRHIHRFRIR